MTPSPRTILLAGGATGGHLFPCIAVWQRLAEHKVDAAPYFAVSTRPLDAEILTKRKLPYTPIEMQPPAVTRPWTWPGFWHTWKRAVDHCHKIIDQLHVAVVVATGGFVAAPAVVAAERAGLPIALVNLDAVPGKANRYLASRATQRFTVYPVDRWPEARSIGLPLIRSAIGSGDAQGARKALEMDPDKRVLMVCGGSQGAESINKTMIELVRLTSVRQGLASWQVLHLAGPSAADSGMLTALRQAYEQAGIPARVETFCNVMGLAWSAATLAIARAGAGTVAEAWTNATPTIFLPYPHHRDQHQRRNAQILVDAGGAVCLKDMIEPARTVRELAGPLTSLLSNATRRQHMVEQLHRKRPDDGADVIARWVIDALDAV